jgi:hypothetical protein
MVGGGRNWDVVNFIFLYFFQFSQQSKAKRKNILSRRKIFLKLVGDQQRGLRFCR